MAQCQFPAALVAKTSDRALIGKTARAAFGRTHRAFLFAFALAVVFAQLGGRAQQAPVPPPDALPYQGGYLVTGDYFVSSVDLNKSKTGFVSGTMPVAGVPQNADIVAAFLYWETISLNNGPHKKASGAWHDPDINPSQKCTSTSGPVCGAQFRGEPLSVGTAMSYALPGPDKSGNVCWAVPGNPSLKVTMFRADVLRLLPLQKDPNGNPTGKRLVNNQDLQAAGLAPNKVQLPGAGTTGVVPESGGAGLVVVYRDPTQPLRKIVFYDGVYVEPPPTAAVPNPTMTQTIQAFYKSAARNAHITHLVGTTP
ncbi:MAG TPA: hypothetical protein VEU08_10200, partial [Vicinamibacterales bacterium]|nr:hypothetical protein [Vicinamibacterales bacterium]